VHSVARGEEGSKGSDLHSSIPTEGAPTSFFVAALPAESPLARNANLFIDYLLWPKIAAKNTHHLMLDVCR
jgi:spermidine/putrescine-binding protein